ncbi:hypothetical protein [Amycolatopsis sp. w19]
MATEWSAGDAGPGRGNREEVEGDGSVKLVRFWIMRLPPPSSIFGNGSW